MTEAADTEGERPASPAAFPMPGRLLRLSYRELDLAINGTAEQRAALGDPADLIRPWLMASVPPGDPRSELWAWLKDIVLWLTSEYVFSPGDALPSCWWRHRHIVHELCVLADQRYRAESALTSDALEDWHRYTLPSFVDRSRARIGGSCSTSHTNWPAATRFARHLGPDGLHQDAAPWRVE